MTRVGVLRLGRLGDLVMTLPALQCLRDAGLDVSLITDPRWAALLPEFDPVGPGAAPPLDALLDLHRTPAARRARRQLQLRGPRVSVRKEDLRRRSLLTPFPLRPRRTWPERHLAAAGRLLDRLGLEPPPADPVPSLPATSAVEPGLLGLVPGAAHATKRWRGFADLARRWPGPVRVFLGPDEGDLAAAFDDVEFWPTALGRLRAGLSACAVVVGGDTGPVHLAAALGRRTVQIFGPTPVDAGFAFWPAGQVLQPDLACAPCSLHGGARCPRGHHRCLGGRSVQSVLDACRQAA